MGGIGSTIMTGMAFGAGSAVAHQAVNSVMGGGSSGSNNNNNGGNGDAQQQQQPQQQMQQAPMEGQMQQSQYADDGYGQQQEAPCQSMNTSFVNCLKQNDSNIQMCQQYMDMIKQCERDQQQYQ